MGRDTTEAEAKIGLDCNNAGSSQKEKRHKCSYEGCSAVFLVPARLQAHIRTHTGERPYKCTHDGCTKGYTNSTHLKRHMRTHTDQRTVIECPKCFLLLSNRAHLKRHYDNAHGENGLTCTQCNMVFSKRHQYKAHMNSHLGIEYKCETCGKMFTDKTKFKKHMRAHTDTKKSYPCTMPGCEEVFHKWALLCAHTKTKHVNDHKCTDCGRVFLNKTHLRYHSMIHREDRPVFSCPYEKCYRFYLFKSNLQAHVNSYHLGKRYFCDICKIGLSMKNKLAYHIKRYHGEPEEEAKKIQKVRKQRKKRKDAGLPKRSVLSRLIGVKMPAEIEKMIMEREPTVACEPDEKQS